MIKYYTKHFSISKFINDEPIISTEIDKWLNGFKEKKGCSHAVVEGYVKIGDYIIITISVKIDD